MKSAGCRNAAANSSIKVLRLVEEKGAVYGNFERIDGRSSFDRPDSKNGSDQLLEVCEEKQG